MLEFLSALQSEGVDFCVLGSAAAAVSGAPVATMEVELCPSLDTANLAKLAGVLERYEMRNRVDQSPAKPTDLMRLSTLRLEGDPGLIDLVAKPLGTEGFVELVEDAVFVDLGECSVRVPSIDMQLRIATQSASVRDRVIADFLLAIR